MAEVYDFDAGFDDPSNKNAWFGRIIGDGKNIFDVGCATGYVGEHLVKKQMCKVWGFEYVEKAAEAARERNCFETVLTGDIQNPKDLSSLPNGKFDYILFGDVLEHLIQPEQALENCKALLAPGGGILICVPSIIHWSIRRDIFFGRFEYTDTGPLDRTHVHFFTPKTARKLVQECGYKIVEQSGVVWLPSIFYKLPNSLRYSLQKFARKISPDYFDGQTLLHIKLC